jgi:hypothetical protein
MVLLILELYSQAIAEDAEDEDEELALFGQQPDESDLHMLFIKKRKSSAPLPPIF